MTKEFAEETVTKYLKPIYAFALKRCACIEDAQDLTQDIALCVYRSLCGRDDISSPDRFIWTAAHNALSNYYRRKRKSVLMFSGVSVEDVQELAASDENIEESVVGGMSTPPEERLRLEIAYLSKLQRKTVIAFYYENKKLNRIAEELGVPLGTVKWHLFEAKKKLKGRMETMKEYGMLKFDPIKFGRIETCGLSGSEGSNKKLLRSALAQNIIYSVREKAKTVNEIADDLAVSPVYVEDETEYLCRFAFLDEAAGKYISRVIVCEENVERSAELDAIYSEAASFFAPALFDSLYAIAEDKRVYGGKFGNVTMNGDTPRDVNFIMWGLIPYVMGKCGKMSAESEAEFIASASLRPDGGRNICTATVASDADSEAEEDFAGPVCFMNGSDGLWIYDSAQSDKRIDSGYFAEAQRILSLFSKLNGGAELSEEELAYLAQRGYVSFVRDSVGTKTVPKCVWLCDEAVRDRLAAAGKALAEKFAPEFDALREKYAEKVLKDTPPHLRKAQSFILKNIFVSDGSFIRCCIDRLVGDGKLKMPTDEQRRSLGIVIETVG